MSGAWCRPVFRSSERGLPHNPEQNRGAALLKEVRATSTGEESGTMWTGVTITIFYLNVRKTKEMVRDLIGSNLQQSPSRVLRWKLYQLTRI